MRRPHALLVAAALLIGACSDQADTADTSGTTAAATMPTEAPGTTAAPTPDAGEPQGTATFTGLEQTHVDTPVEYPQTPPVGGPHNPAWQTCAFYDKPIMAERGVHSMEHGAVWITFDPGLDAASVAALRALQASGREVLVSPYSGLPAPIVASAWGKQLVPDGVDDPRLAQFVQYFDDGPQTPELGTPCSGGLDDTLG